MSSPPRDDPPPGSLLSQLRSFNKGKLSKTETVVTTTDGRKLLESTDSTGRTVSQEVTRGLYGFIPDRHLDLQVGEILPGFIMGSQDVASDEETLNKYNVTHILNVATGVANTFPETIQYKNLTIMDLPGFHILPFFDSAFEFIDEGRSDGCVFLHCNAGISRAATFAIGYFMKTEGKSFSDAYAYVKGKRPSIYPNPGFIAQLETHGERLEAMAKGS